MSCWNYHCSMCTPFLSIAVSTSTMSCWNYHCSMCTPFLSIAVSTSTMSCWNCHCSMCTVDARGWSRHECWSCTNAGWNTIAFNRAHDYKQMLNDGGGIYMLSPQNGSEIHDNWVWVVGVWVFRAACIVRIGRYHPFKLYICLGFILTNEAIKSVVASSRFRFIERNRPRDGSSQNFILIHTVCALVACTTYSVFRVHVSQVQSAHRVQWSPLSGRRLRLLDMVRWLDFVSLYCFHVLNLSVFGRFTKSFGFQYVPSVQLSKFACSLFTCSHELHCWNMMFLLLIGFYGCYFRSSGRMSWSSRALL